MAELGLIGSSIAHELNNPLGGMLNFLQLIKMDLDGNEPWFEDIDEMEKGAQRCRDIIESLLGFTRKSPGDLMEKIDLRDVINQALNIIELQTRARGIKVIKEMPLDPAFTLGHTNALVHAVIELLKSGTGFMGEIQVKLSLQDQWNVVEIRDNEPNQDPLINSSLGVTLAHKIVNDHGGRLELNTTQAVGHCSKVYIPRPVFES